MLSEALRLGLYCEWALLSRLVGSTEYVGPTTQYLSSPSVSHRSEMRCEAGA